MSVSKSCFVDDDKKLCFINIPKNASTTIRTLLNLKHCEYSQKYNDYKKIVVIRNPLTRAVAMFNEIIKLIAN